MKMQVFVHVFAAVISPPFAILQHVSTGLVVDVEFGNLDWFLVWYENASDDDDGLWFIRGA